jgi:hypothetical protein
MEDNYLSAIVSEDSQPSDPFYESTPTGPGQDIWEYNPNTGEYTKRGQWQFLKPPENPSDNSSMSTKDKKMLTQIITVFAIALIGVIIITQIK